MKTARDIADTLGHDAIAAAVGVTSDAVSVALRRTGKFPSAWFIVLRRVCADAGFECSEDAFNWRPPVSEVSCLPPDNRNDDGAVQ